ncbi:DEAD-box protein 3 [Microsporum canis CBS 113480]|uniref:RNA helicase n=1 Tax=Arthroderma otae (strain ATCC MYA-4605 / CBS 113480) TaxID=554155 RepID=C5FZ84_ARTOC|nr:DEAD-box protein 3 [Microsporum canis CBS 113480]EEQ35187.1 DEAD-box protein 3 [Microsporum canis CBS 113480]
MSVTSAEVVVAPPREPLDEMAALAAALPGGEESAAMAREKGWVVPQRYNYEAYNALNKDMVADALPWASNSAKYEWKEEYGDVGPPNEELEQMLFKDEYIPRVGKLLEKLMGKAKKLATPRPDLGNGFNESLDAVRAEPLVLVVVPTRELATQIFDEARRLCYRSMLRPCVIYGGGPTRDQRTELQKGCDILIATPGRLIDFMEKPNVLSLCRVRYTIIDEADELLKADWEAEFTKILVGGDINEDADHRYMMFSATFNKGCRQVALKYLANDYVRIRIGRVGSTHLNVTQQFVWAEESMKKRCLYDLLMAMPPSRTIVFVNNKTQADFIDDFFRAFKTAKSPILIATAISARGLDIKNVMHVVNYDLPSINHGGIDEYIHRIGRTARIGNPGLATSFYNDKNSDIAGDLVKILIESKQVIPDFLQGEAPPDGVLNFDDDTDEEGGDGDNAGADDVWGAPPPPAAAAGFAEAPAVNTDTQGAWSGPADGNW